MPAMTAMTPIILTTWLHMDIVDTPIAGHFPALNGVVVIERADAADADQGGAGRLDIPRVVGTATLQDGFLPLPLPGEAEHRQGFGQDRVLQGRQSPALAPVRTHLHMHDLATSCPGQPTDLHEAPLHGQFS